MAVSMGRCRAGHIAQSHITSTATNAEAAADKATCSKIKKIRTSEYYSQLYSIRSGNRRFMELWNNRAHKRHRKEKNSDQLRTTRDTIPVSTDFHRSPERQCHGVPKHIPKRQYFSDPWEPLHRTFNLISVFKPTGLVVVGEHNNNTFAFDFRSVRFSMYLLMLLYNTK